MGLKKGVLGALIVIVYLFTSCSNENKAEVLRQVSFSADTVFYQNFSKETANKIQNYYALMAGQNNLNGCVLVAEKDSVFVYCYGKKEFDKKEDLNPTTLFQLASVSKPFTAAAVLLLAQNNKLDLDEKVSKWIEGFPYKTVTIRHLLSHMSGLPNYMYLTDQYWQNKSTYMTNKEVLDYLIAKKPDPYLSPGKRFNYCNTNYALLASIVEKASGTGFESFMKSELFSKAKMSSAAFFNDVTRDSLANVATGHNVKLKMKEPFYLDGVLGDKSLFASVYDLYAFHVALVEGYLLSDKWMEEMLERNTPKKSKKNQYALGWRMQQLNKTTWHYHNGWWKGFKTSFWNDFKNKRCIVILTNTTRDGHMYHQPLMEMLGWW